LATILASQNGNFNSTSTWTGGVVPSTGDSAIANGKTVTITASVTCLELKNDTSGGAALGGYYLLNSGVNLTANLYHSAPSLGILQFTSSSASANSTINGNITAVANSQAAAVVHSSSGTLNVFGDIYGATTANGSAVGINFSGSGYLVVTGNSYGGGQTSHGIAVGAGSLTLNGNAVGAVTGSSSGASGLHLSSGSKVYINGNVISSNTASPNGNGINILNCVSANVTVVGDVVGSGQATNSGIIMNGGGNNVVNITGNVYGASNNTSAIAIVNSSSINSITINGNVTGGSSSGPGINNDFFSSVTVNGNVTGGTGSAGIANGSGTIIVSGNVTAGTGAPGISNLSSGDVYAKRSIGNGFGFGSTGITAQVGVSNSGTGTAYVQEIQYGPLGMSPTYGRIFLTDLSTNVCLFYRSGTTQKTLVDPASLSGYLPSASDTRLNVPIGNSAGTMNVPSSLSVDYGVAVYNTTGKAAFSASSVLNYLTSNMTSSGSIGERVKNAATVATCGKQLANALTDIQK